MTVTTPLQDTIAVELRIRTGQVSISRAELRFVCDVRPAMIR